MSKLAQASVASATVGLGRYLVNTGALLVPILPPIMIYNEVKKRFISGTDIRGIAMNGGLHGIYSGVKQDGSRNNY